MYTCSIVGATGYTGAELIRLLSGHPRVKLVHLTTRGAEKIPARSLVPSLSKNQNLVIQRTSLKQVARDSQIVFLALPHTTAAEVASDLLKDGTLVIDLSADFRLKNVKEYKTWYGVKHARPALLKQAVYGLPELYRQEIQNANLIANPGCYPTSILLGLLPLVREKLIDFESIIADSKSGVSGAGKKLSTSTHFSEANENFSTYKVDKHQHLPEILQVLNEIAIREKVSVTFVPHLLPVMRGILSTIYGKLRSGVKPKHVVQAYERYYTAEPFVRFCGEEQFPSLRDVQYTNFCDIGLRINVKTRQVIIVSAIDNLLKGASGQAVQNMNIRCGFPEDAGLC